MINCKLVLDLPSDLEAVIRKRAEQAGLDVPTYVLQTLRTSDLDQAGDASISTEQFEASLARLREIHASVPAQFADSRESIYEVEESDLGISGKRAHDARLVAAMQRHGLQQIVSETFSSP